MSAPLRRSARLAAKPRIDFSIYADDVEEDNKRSDPDYKIYMKRAPTPEPGLSAEKKIRSLILYDDEQLVPKKTMTHSQLLTYLNVEIDAVKTTQLVSDYSTLHIINVLDNILVHEKFMTEYSYIAKDLFQVLVNLESTLNKRTHHILSPERILLEKVREGKSVAIRCIG